MSDSAQDAWPKVSWASSLFVLLSGGDCRIPVGDIRHAQRHHGFRLLAFVQPFSIKNEKQDVCLPAGACVCVTNACNPRSKYCTYLPTVQYSNVTVVQFCTMSYVVYERATSMHAQKLSNNLFVQYEYELRLHTVRTVEYYSRMVRASRSPCLHRRRRLLAYYCTYFLGTDGTHCTYQQTSKQGCKSEVA